MRCDLTSTEIGLITFPFPYYVWVGFERRELPRLGEIMFLSATPLAEIFYSLSPSVKLSPRFMKPNTLDHFSFLSISLTCISYQRHHGLVLGRFKESERRLLFRDVRHLSGT